MAIILGVPSKRLPKDFGRRQGRTAVCGHADNDSGRHLNNICYDQNLSFHEQRCCTSALPSESGLIKSLKRLGSWRIGQTQSGHSEQIGSYVWIQFSYRYVKFHTLNLTVHTAMEPLDLKLGKSLLCSALLKGVNCMVRSGLSPEALRGRGPPTEPVPPSFGSHLLAKAQQFVCPPYSVNQCTASHLLWI